MLERGDFVKVAKKWWEFMPAVYQQDKGDIQADMYGESFDLWRGCPVDLGIAAKQRTLFVDCQDSIRIKLFAIYGDQLNTTYIQNIRIQRTTWLAPICTSSTLPWRSTW
jgi:hypothetical protein